MSTLRSSTVFRRLPALTRPRVVTVNRFASGSTVHDDDPIVLEVEKRRNLSKTQHYTSTTYEDAPGWNEYLASTSEAHVKADRHGLDGPPTIELAERTIKHVQQRHPAQGNSRQEASYERDEVEGPLKTSLPGSTDEMQSGDGTSSKEKVKAERGDV